MCIYIYTYHYISLLVLSFIVIHPQYEGTPMDPHLLTKPIESRIDQWMIRVTS